MFGNKDSKNLAILIFLALSIRVILLFNICLIARDGVLQYIPAAELYAAGEYKKALSQVQTPLYPFLMGVISRIGPRIELAGQLISLILNVLTIIPLYFLGKRLFKNSDISFLAGFLFAIHPYLARLSVDVLKETTYIFFFITALLLSWEAFSSKKLPLYPVAGAMIGLSCLVRADGMEILVIMSLWILFQGNGDYLRSFKKRILSLLLLSIFSFFLAIPYVWHVKQTTGEWNLSMKKSVGILTGQKNLEENDIKEDLNGEKYVRGLSLLVSKAVKSFHPLFLIVLIFGLVGRRTIPYQKGEELLLATFFVVHLAVLYLITINYRIFQGGSFSGTYFSSRHILPLTTISFFWIAIGIIEIQDRIQGWLATKRDGAFSLNLSRNIFIIILVVISVSILPKTLKPLRTDKLGLKAAGIWIKDNSGKKSPVIMSNMPRVAYYAGGNLIRFPRTSFKRIVQYAKIKADYLAINDRSIDQWVPGFIKSSEKNDSLRKVFEYREKHGDQVIVYEIVGR